MRLSEYEPSKTAYIGANTIAVEPDGRERPLTRIELEFARMRKYEQYGDWNIVDKVPSACCPGGIVSTLSGAGGRVEAWNNGEVWFIPKRNGEPAMVRDIDTACAMALITERML